MAEVVTWRVGIPPAKEDSGPFRQSELYRYCEESSISCKDQAHRDTISRCSGEGVGWYYFLGVLFYSG